MDARDPDRLLQGLDPSQRAAVVEPARPLAILAGPGSGKTRVLTRRIAWQAATGHADPRHVLAVTFTRKAARELVQRLARLPGGARVTAGSFHALALAQLRRRWQDQRRAAPALLTRKARVLAPLLVAAGCGGDDTAARAADVAAEIEWAKARLVAPDAYEAAARDARRYIGLDRAQVASLYAAYERDKHRRLLVDFDDLVVLCVRALEADTEFAAAQRFRFRHLFVDEMQDLTPAQFRLLRGWLGDRDDLCAVGDPDQSIYRFAGADPGHLTRFAEHFPGGKVVHLDANHRSTGAVVAAARAVLGRATSTGVPSTRRDGPRPAIRAFASDLEEARGVARALRDEHARGTRWSSMAVLHRTNAQSALFEEALAAQQVPVRVRGGQRFLQRDDVRALLDALDDAARRAPGRPFVDHLVDVRTDVDGMPGARREHGDALVTLGQEYVAHDGDGGTVPGFVAWLRATLRSDDGDLAPGDAVELSTFHRAKGLEYEVVFVTGLESGLVPIAYAVSDTDVDEERRLLHVALTRAATGLHLSWARTRTVGTRVATREPSPWLATLRDADVVDDADAPRPPASPHRGTRPRLAPAAVRPHAGRRADDALHAALVEWRRDVARAAAVPASAVIGDAALRAVATRRPRSRAALGTVPGLGPCRLARYGDAILAVVARATADAPGSRRLPR